MTRLVNQALKSVGIVLHDHVIISRKGHTSFKEMRLL
jgi:DNA repair protein RadC